MLEGVGREERTRLLSNESQVFLQGMFRRYVEARNRRICTVMQNSREMEFDGIVAEAWSTSWPKQHIDTAVCVASRWHSVLASTWVPLLALRPMVGL